MKIINRTVEGSFIKRLNRFEGIVETGGREVLVHIPNTGRCRAVAFFLVQMEAVDYFTPNKLMHVQFAEALKYADYYGVEILSFDCRVCSSEIILNKKIPVIL